MFHRSLVPPAILVAALFGTSCRSENRPTGPTTIPTRDPTLLGEYRLTFTAAPSCSLPPEAGNVTFPAWVWEPTPGSIRVDVRAPTNFECWGCRPGFTGTRDGDTFHFLIVGGPPGDGVVEFIPIGGQVRYEGEGLATLRDGNITGTFSGLIEASNGVAVAACRATDHKMNFVHS